MTIIFGKRSKPVLICPGHQGKKCGSARGAFLVELGVFDVTKAGSKRAEELVTLGVLGEHFVEVGKIAAASEVIGELFFVDNHEVPRLQL